MANVQSVSIHFEKPWKDIVKRRYQVTLLDNNSTEHVVITSAVKVDSSDDGASVGQQVLQEYKDVELSEKDITTLWNDTQADYDRRALGRAMNLTDTHEFYSFLPLFQAMEGRGGANAIQRAAYLGVSIENYNLMATRFGDVQGIAFFLDNEKDQIWDTIPQEFT
jgi:hypothetical protein